MRFLATTFPTAARLAAQQHARMSLFHLLRAATRPALAATRAVRQLGTYPPLRFTGKADDHPFARVVVRGGRDGTGSDSREDRATRDSSNPANHADERNAYLHERPNSSGQRGNTSWVDRRGERDNRGSSRNDGARYTADSRDRGPSHRDTGRENPREPAQRGEARYERRSSNYSSNSNNSSSNNSSRAYRPPFRDPPRAEWGSPSRVSPKPNVGTANDSSAPAAEANSPGEFRTADGRLWVRHKRELPPYLRTNFWVKQIQESAALGKDIDVEKFLERMKAANTEPNIDIYNNLLAQHVRDRRMNQAFLTYNSMKKRGLTPNAYTHSMLFNVCAEAEGDFLTRAVQLLQTIQEKDLDRNTETYNSLIKVCVRARSMEKCMEAFEAMCEDVEKYSTQPNNITYSLMLQACCIDGDFHQSTDLLRIAKQLGAPDLQLIHTFLQACRSSISRKDLSVEERESIAAAATAEVQGLSKMKLQPTAASFDLLFSVLSYAPTSSNLEKVLADLIQTRSIESLDEVAWSTVLRAAGRLDSVELFGKIVLLLDSKNIKVTPRMCHAIALAAADLKDYELGFRLVLRFHKAGVDLNEHVVLALALSLFRCFTSHRFDVPQMRFYTTQQLEFFQRAKISPTPELVEMYNRCLLQRKSTSLCLSVVKTVTKIKEEERTRSWQEFAAAAARTLDMVKGKDAEGEDADVR